MEKQVRKRGGAMEDTFEIRPYNPYLENITSRPANQRQVKEKSEEKNSRRRIRKRKRRRRMRQVYLKPVCFAEVGQAHLLVMDGR